MMQRLDPSPTRNNENHKLEFPWAWDPLEIQTIHDLVKIKVLYILFLQETKLLVRRMETLKFQLGFDCYLAVDREGRSGGLTLMWKNDVQLTITNLSKHHIDAQVIKAERVSREWRLKGIYR